MRGMQNGLCRKAGATMWHLSYLSGKKGLLLDLAYRGLELTLALFPPPSLSSLEIMCRNSSDNLTSLP